MGNFIDGVKLAIPPAQIEDRDGLSYISWVTALAMAQRPAQTVVHFNGKPATPMFGGVIVAVDMPLSNGKVQRTYMPVLNNRKQAVPASAINVRDVTNTVARARAKAVAMVTGVGLCLYANYDGDAPRFVKELGLGPEGDPAGVQPISTEKKSKSGKFVVQYLDWAVALAAARITDANFHWEVVTHAVVDGDGEIHEKLFLPFAKGYLVTLKVTWRGKEHIELLPVMGEGHQPLEQPTAADWNRAVMRCLAKGISVVTGYGLSLYAGEDLTMFAEQPEGPDPMFVDQAQASGAKYIPATGTVPAPAAPVHNVFPYVEDPFAKPPPVPAQAAKPSTVVPINSGPSKAPVAVQQSGNRITDLAMLIENNLRDTKRDKTKLVSWLGFPPGTSFTSMPLAVLERGYKAISSTGTPPARTAVA